MKKRSSLFTEEELKAMRLADEEIEKDFSMTPDDWKRSKAMDRQARIDRLDNKGRRIADYQAAYREANKEKIADYQAAYREANKEKIAAQKAAYREANKEKIAAQKAAYIRNNREKWNAYQREYRRRKKLLALQEEKENRPGRSRTDGGMQECTHAPKITNLGGNVNEFRL